MIARRIDETNTTFKLKFEFSYKEIYIMPNYGIGLLITAIILLLIALIILILYRLHMKGIIEIKIAKPFRIFCFKNYLSS
jgi:hypothetical protein